MKIRSRSWETDAEQYSLQRHLDEGYVPEGVVKKRLMGDDGDPYEGIPYVDVHGGGQWRVEDRDWIIKGLNGRFYICSPEDFEYLYDMRLDGIEDSEIGAEMGIGLLRFDEWFEPFLNAATSVHPYSWEEKES